MQFNYKLDKSKYTSSSMPNNKLNLIKKIMKSLSKSIFKWYFETIMYTNLQNREVKNFEISINDNSISVVSDMSEIHIGWEAVKSINIKFNVILIRYGLGKKITLPLSLITFKNENEKLQFKSALEHKMDE